MTTLHAQIAALPEWPDKITNFDISLRDWGRWQHEGRLAALARLALAREWIAATKHLSGCARTLPFYPSDDLSDGLPACACGRDALLKALEVPK